MKKILPVVVVLGLAAAAFAYWITPDLEEAGVLPNVALQEGALVGKSASIEVRLATIERAMHTERQARQLLQEEVFFLTEELERLSTPDLVTESAPEIVETTQIADARRAEFRRRGMSADREERLVNGGFTKNEAAWIVRRESELRMASLQARYDAERNGTEQGYSQSRQAAGNQLRDELGDEDYARYLEANGRSTRVAVSNVLESSPAQIAGLRMGDEILNYDGQRVFSMSDLSRETLRGEPGQNVVVDFVRDGVQMQAVIARGPFGIVGGRRYSR